MGRSRSRSREREVREEKTRPGDRGDRDEGRRGRDRGDEIDRIRRKDSRSRSPPRRHFREDDSVKEKSKPKEKENKSQATEESKSEKQERRRAETAIKRQKMLEEERKERDKVRGRMDLIREIKGDLSGEDDGMGSGSDDDNDGTGELTEEQQMVRLMGFSGFNSTKGKGVAENNRGPAKGAISKHKKREYRQYMNRRGGFNRPLSKMP